MSNWKKDLEFSKESAKQWKVYLEGFMGKYFIRYHDYEEDLAVQKSNMDLAMVCGKPLGLIGVELKTRRAEWTRSFQIDNKIAIETIGNMEKGNVGSGIENCNADIWCYGFFDGENLIGPMIFNKRKLVEYMANKKGGETKTSQTQVGSGKYHTKFELVNVDLLKNCRINNVDDLLEIRK